MPQHNNEWFTQLEDLSNFRLNWFTSCTAKLILFLRAATTLNGDGVIHVFIFCVFV
jgi:hypothetical protein